MGINNLENSLDSILNLDKEQRHTILIVDDEENNLQLLKRTFRGKYDILVAHNGQEAIDVVHEHGDKISLIVSDQKMPVMEGTDFFKAIRYEYPQIVKVLLTGHVDTDILVAAINDCDLYQYILKPFEPEELKIVAENGIKKYTMATDNEEYYNELRELFYKTIRAISSALDTKDAYTNGHSLRVTIYSIIIAKELGFTQEQLEEIEIAGLLHDIGKISIPTTVLCKNGKLTDQEFLIMKSHPVKSGKIVINIKKLATISEWVKAHHEKWDGSGYPDGLKGEEIPLVGRIIALADTYDAMTSTRPYRTALPHEVAISEVQRCSGIQFDPKLAEIFIKLSDKIDEARKDPEAAYEKYSLLAHNVDLRTAEFTQVS